MNDGSANRVLDRVDEAAADLGRLLGRPVDLVPGGAERVVGAVVGTLVGFADAGAIPLVV